MIDLPRTLRTTKDCILRGWHAFVVAVFLAGCGKEAPPAAHAMPKKLAVQAQPSPKPGGPEFDEPAPAAEKEITPEEAALQRQVDDVLDQHPQMNAQELLNVPEVKESVGEFLKQLSQSPELQNRINSSIAFAAAMKDLRGPKESLNFNMDVSGYDKDTTRQMLGSLLSHDAGRVVSFFEKQVGEATAEFALDPAAPKSNNGISVSPKPSAR